jgi:hypothetical protein
MAKELMPSLQLDYRSFYSKLEAQQTTAYRKRESGLTIYFTDILYGEKSIAPA